MAMIIDLTPAQVKVLRFLNDQPDKIAPYDDAARAASHHTVGARRVVLRMLDLLLVGRDEGRITLTFRGIMSYRAYCEKRDAKQGSMASQLTLQKARATEASMGER